MARGSSDESVRLVNTEMKPKLIFVFGRIRSLPKSIEWVHQFWPKANTETKPKLIFVFGRIRSLPKSMYVPLWPNTETKPKLIRRWENSISLLRLTHMYLSRLGSDNRDRILPNTKISFGFISVLAFGQNWCTHSMDLGTGS